MTAVAREAVAREAVARDDPSPPPGVRLDAVLAELGARVAPTAMARERTLPVDEVFADLCGELVRGRVVSCAGPAATSVALGLIAPAIAAGSWVAVIDVPTLGLDAASELGVPLERIVAIDTGAGLGAAERGSVWADAVAAAADGFDVMVVRAPGDVRASTVRKVATRLQQRGVVMVVLGDPGALVCDVVLDTTGLAWSGLGAGWGHLRRRTVEVSASGRRLPGRRTRTIDLPHPCTAAQTTLLPGRHAVPHTTHQPDDLTGSQSDQAGGGVTAREPEPPRLVVAAGTPSAGALSTAS